MSEDARCRLSGPRVFFVECSGAGNRLFHVCEKGFLLSAAHIGRAMLFGAMLPRDIPRGKCAT